MNILGRVGLAAAGSVGAAAAGYGYARWESQAYTLRRFDVPVLDPGSAPMTVLHLADLHLRTDDSAKVAWVRDLASLSPDLVVNTGDTISELDALPTVLEALEPLAAFPAVFVPGNNDYYVPSRPKWASYVSSAPRRSTGQRLPWDDIAGAMVDQGWTDVTHRRTVLTAADRPVFVGGLDDPHLRRARYGRIAGAADPTAAVRLGVLHSPEPWLLTRFAADRYDLALAGHTHGGQLRVPFGPALITNCGIDRARARWLHRWDDHMWFHVCAGLGTNPYTRVRFACRPEASLLTLVPRA